MTTRPDEIGRATVDGEEWVLYHDGLYRHVVVAADYERGYEVGPDEAEQVPYTEWCENSEFADDELAAVVAGMIGVDYVHSAGGTCARIDAPRPVA